MKPLVAIVGRPNVGKSTLFNRITKTRDAIVDDFPGVTRDVKYGDAKWEGFDFLLVDTGGFTETDMDPLAKDIRQQVAKVLDEADAAVLLLDAKSGLGPYDRDMVDLMRKSRSPVFFVVNKVDGLEKEDLASDFYSLGVEAFHTISAAHGYGINDFLDELVRVLKQKTRKAAPAKEDEKEPELRLAVVGRPNVGKSSLVNRILRLDRLLVSNLPGTTRDSVDIPIEKNNHRYRLVDTAGIRRKARVSEKLEKFSVIKALKALDRCQVAVVLLDASEGVTDQDIRIAGYAAERGRGCILAINKWDLAPSDPVAARRIRADLRDAARFLPHAPILTISAKTGLRINKIFDAARQIYSQYATRLSTGRVNRIFETAVEKKAPPMVRGKRVRFFYATQVGVEPPTFVCFVSNPNALHFSYQRYLMNRLREEAGLDKTPIRLYFRERPGRRDQKRKTRKR